MSNIVSVVISTRKKDEKYVKKLQKAFSHPKTEFLIYENNNEYSLSEIYNKGLAESTNNFVVFMHDDIFIDTKNVTDKVFKLFKNNPEYGIIGVAGTTDLVSGVWWELRQSLHGQVYHQRDGKKWLSKYSNNLYGDKVKDVVCVDGLFFIVDKNKLKNNFDEDFKGFHFYDISFCLRNKIEGVNIGVTTKFDIVHDSIGMTNNEWETNKQLFEDKYKEHLPYKLTNAKSYEEKLNYSKDSIGLGIVTYNAPERLKQSVLTVPSWIKHFVVVNDGTPYDKDIYPTNAYVIQHDVNKCVGEAKNSAISYLMEAGCEHIFIMEDDVLIKDEKVFDEYIKTSLETGIKHLNYGLQGPANKKGATGFTNLEERASQAHLTEPNPREVVKYPNGVEVALYTNIIGAFSYYQREVLENIGGFDSNFKNAWEHVEHTYTAFKKGYTTPFWWFADINNSWEYLTDIEGCMENSTIAKTDTWKGNMTKGLKYFQDKHGVTPTGIPDTPKEVVSNVLSYLYQLR